MPPMEASPTDYAALQDRLQDPDTARALHQLLDRVDTLNQSLTMLDEAPALLSMGADVVDEQARQARATGVDLEARLQTLQATLARLTEPATQQALHDLLDLAQQGPQIAAMAGDILDDTARGARARGIDIEARRTRLLGLLERLTREETLDALEDATQLATSLPQVLAMIGDIFDDSIRRLRASGVDVERLLSSSSDAVHRLLTSGILDPEALDAVGGLGKALQEAQACPTKPMGFWSAIKSLRDPDVGRALCFFIEFARAFGRSLNGHQQ
jgi:uncharacterized protein YjgD (DUF1641 family)